MQTNMIKLTDQELKTLYENRDSYVRIGRNLTGKFWQEYRKKHIDPIERQIEKIKSVSIGA